jgi:hypothetical protein
MHRGAAADVTCSVVSLGGERKSATQVTPSHTERMSSVTMPVNQDKAVLQQGDLMALPMVKKWLAQRLQPAA